MSSKQLFYVLWVTIVVLLAGLIGGAYGVDKLLSSQSKQLVRDRLQAAVLSQEQTQLTQDKKDIKTYQGLATIAQSIVPQDKDQAQTVRQIVNLAAQNGVTLSSITFPTSTLGNSGKTSSNLQLSQLTPVAGIPGVYGLQLTVQSNPTVPVPYGQFIAFLSALEHNRRTALVNGITLQPNNQNRNVLSFTLLLDEYIKP